MTAPQALKVEIAQLSDPGRDPNKQINEDSCGYAKTRFGHLCVLCDGMGGHYGGQEASRRAITTIFEQIDKAQPGATPAMALKASIEEAARRVYELGGAPDNRARPGSTVVAILMHDSGVDVAHVGDSRAYVVRSDQIYPLTRDHSMVQSMIDAGMLTEEQAIGHPDANKITRALGMKPEVEVDVRPESMELFPGDLLVLTSDGLTDLALSNDILQKLRETLRVGTLNDACTELVKMANDRGGHDNITVQLARVVRTAPKQTRAGVTTTGEVSGAGAGVSPTVAGNEPERRASHTIPIPGSNPRAVEPHAAGPTVNEGPAHVGHAAPQHAPIVPVSPIASVPHAGAAHLSGHPVAGHPSAHPAPGLAPMAGVGPTAGGVGPTIIQPDAQSPSPPSIRFGGAANQSLAHERDPHGPMSTRYIPQPSPSGGGLGAYPAAQGNALARAPSPLARTEPTRAVRPTPVDHTLPPSMSPYSLPEASVQGRGSVLFLWLGASFFVATLALFVVWALFLR